MSLFPVLPLSLSLYSTALSDEFSETFCGIASLLLDFRQFLEKSPEGGGLMRERKRLMNVCETGEPEC